MFKTEPSIEAVTENDTLPRRAQIRVAVTTTQRHGATLPLTTQCWVQRGRSLNVSNSCDVSTSRRIVKGKAATRMMKWKTCTNSRLNTTNRWVVRGFDCRCSSETPRYVIRFPLSSGSRVILVLLPETSQRNYSAHCFGVKHYGWMWKICDFQPVSGKTE